MKAFRPLDFVLLLVFLAVCAWAIVAVTSRGKQSAPLLIVNSPDGEYVYPLAKDREISVLGAIGNSVLVIKDGKAFFKDSPCPNKTCVQTGELTRNNDWAACLPNQVIIHVEASGEKDELDTVVR